MITTSPQPTILQKAFDECFPPDWCIQILKALNTAWIESHEYCRSRKFGVDPGKDVVAHLLRARVETEIFRVSSSFPNIKAESRKNIAKTTSHTYVEAQSNDGQRMILTASAVHNPQARPRKAEFRDVLNTNGQLDLFNIQSPIEDNIVYGLLLYGSPQAVSPGFINIAFPDGKLRRYVESIHLMARYPGIINNPISEENDITPKRPQPVKVAPEEEIQKEQSPRIRPRRKAVGDQ